MHMVYEVENKKKYLFVMFSNIQPLPLFIDYIFVIFPRKQDLTFHANCLHWRQFA